MRRPRPRAAPRSARGSRPGAGSRSPGRGPPWPTADSGLRSANTNSSTAPPTPASAAIAAGERAGLVDEPLGEQLPGDREREHRPDQVRAAALGAPSAPRPGRAPARSRRSPCARPRGRRRAPGRAVPPAPAARRAAAHGELAADGARARAGEAGWSRRRWRRRRRARRGSSNGSRAEAQPHPRQRDDRQRLGEAQRAAQQRRRAQPAAGQRGLRARGDLDPAVGGARGDRPRGRPVDQEPVAKRHPAEAQRAPALRAEPLELAGRIAHPSTRRQRSA